MPSEDVLPSLLSRLLAGDLPGALAALVDGAALTSAVLRDADGGLLAVAGDVVRAVPERRSSRPPATGVLAAGEAPLEVPVGPGAVLAVAGARPSALPLLSAAADALALALRARPGAALLVLADDDLDAHADALHDGPVQALVAARWAVDAATRAGVLSARDAADLRASVQEALVGLRRTLWQLRPRGAEDLADALSALAARTAEAGLLPLTVVVEPGACAGLPDATGALVYRLVQAAVQAPAAAGGPVRPLRVHVRALPDSGGVGVDLDGAVPLAHPDRWRTRLAAVGGDLSSSAGRLRVRLPLAPPPPSPAPSPAAPATPKASP